MATSAPASAKTVAISAPMPREAPVTRAHFPSRLNRLARSSIGGVGKQVRREVAVERRECISTNGRVPEADVAIGTDHNHAAPREPGARGVDARVARDLHEPGPASAELRERRGVDL